ncbi:MAG: ZIP family metal transporter, partial [Propionibacteriales bacterium]|nr:ZIP family metal transporter [Propionibacteriales bacterium]
MSATVARAAILVAFPVAAAVVGSTVAAFRRPGPKLTSGVQHFAAGVVFAAVAGEVLPDLRREGQLPAVVVGFSVGVVLLLALGAYGRRVEAANETGKEDATGRLPLGLLAAVGIDLLIDGLLVGLGVTLG